MQEQRINIHGQKAVGSGPVIYWMQAAVRIDDNPALNYALAQAKELNRPFFVFFGLDFAFPGANHRSFTFLFQGLESVRAQFESRGIKFFILKGTGPELLKLIPKDVGLLVTDRGYLSLQRSWRAQVAQFLPCRFVEVETETCVPVEVASPKDQWSAATLRRRLVPLLPFFADPESPGGITAMAGDLPSGWSDLVLSPEEILKKIQTLEILPGNARLKGGENAALELLESFAACKLADYDKNKNDPVLQASSGLSPYLHFGHISPRRIRTRILQESGGENSEAFLEQLIVRRELSFNYSWYNPLAGTYEGLPAWARKTLDGHAMDSREYTYGLEQWDKGETHDRGWNAAQIQLRQTGVMAGYMRMYWGKKILEWSKTPQLAFVTALYLNNKYALDGRDSNSIVGVAWCFGLHDRPWGERKVFGMIRYMNEKGLRRKFDLEAYIQAQGKSESSSLA